MTVWLYHIEKFAVRSNWQLTRLLARQSKYILKEFHYNYIQTFQNLIEMVCLTSDLLSIITRKSIKTRPPLKRAFNNVNFEIHLALCIFLSLN